MNHTPQALALVLLAAGCSPPIGGLEGTEAVTVYSLDPQIALPGAPESELFHSYRILGHSEVREPARRAEIIEAVQDAIRAGGDQAKCFNPRHGVATINGNSRTDFVICFECSNVTVGAEEQMHAISGSAQPVLDRVLREAGVTPAPSP